MGMGSLIGGKSHFYNSHTAWARMDISATVAGMYAITSFWRWRLSVGVNLYSSVIPDSERLVGLLAIVVLSFSGRTRRLA